MEQAFARYLHCYVSISGRFSEALIAASSPGLIEPRFRIYENGGKTRVHIDRAS
jgi:hypothetical protein